MKGTVRGAYATFGTPRLGSSAWRIQDARSADPLTLTCEEPPVFLFANAFGNAVNERSPSPYESGSDNNSRLIVIANGCYWAAAGDTTLGRASELLLFQTVGAGVEPLLLFCSPEFGDAAARPLSELASPGVP